MGSGNTIGSSGGLVTGGSEGVGGGGPGTTGGGRTTVGGAGGGDGNTAGSPIIPVWSNTKDLTPVAPGTSGVAVIVKVDAL